MLRITFLGTGTSQGVPMIACPCEVCHSTDMHDKRLRSSVMIEKFAVGNTGSEPQARIIIDAGPDFRSQMLRENITWIDAILLTHEHKDHIGGIDDVRAFNYFQSGDVSIYATERVAKIVRKDFDYAFAENPYPGAPAIDLKIIDPETPFQVSGIEITPIEGLHYRLPVLGFRMENIAYLTDFNHIDDANIAKLRGLEILVINALRHEEHLSHYNVRQAVEVSRAIGAKTTYLTHMSHQIGIYEEIRGSLPEGIHYAYDTLKVETTQE